MAVTARTKPREIEEFGDFQTPRALADAVCKTLQKLGAAPHSIVEPTCGRGSLLSAAWQRFGEAERALGLEINSSYLAEAADLMDKSDRGRRVRLSQADFFATDWAQVFASLPEPILVIGNPPWVTNSAIGALHGQNTPVKANFQNYRGIEALTGKSNFDISEWMLLRLCREVQERRCTLAMLCKTAVARKVLDAVWQQGWGFSDCRMYGIDAREHFGAAVDACLFVMQTGVHPAAQECQVYSTLTDDRPDRTIGFRDGGIVADVTAYDRWRHLEDSCITRWRSGVKHDCAKVFEFTREANGWRNGLGELVTLETTRLFPMLKSSELANGEDSRPSRWMLVTQDTLSADTELLAAAAPLTWSYLQRHARRIADRGSRIYRGKPPFAMFGVGSYTFSPWKVGISGFYKKLRFRLIGPHEDRPVVLDDTCYFLPCPDRDSAVSIHAMLSSEPAQSFLSALIFWDSKRPITAEVLRRLDLQALARELSTETGAFVWQSLTTPRKARSRKLQQAPLFH